MAAVSPSVRVGGCEVDLQEAERLISDYVRPAAGVASGYLYDVLDTKADPDELADADLLAPNVLNAPVHLKEFHALQLVRSDLERHLRSIPVDLQLATATADELAPLSELFTILDQLQAHRAGIGAVIFSKVLHRKRPGVVPIIDRNVLFCYQRMPAPERGRIPFDRTRSWSEFVRVLTSAMRDDLDHSPDHWNHLADLANRPRTLLRALDIVAWRVGNHPPLPGEVDP